MDFQQPDKVSVWSDEEMENDKLVYYKATTGTVDRGGFNSHLAFDSETGVLYCHIMEYAP